MRLEWIDSKALTPNPANWRRHPKAQKDALEAVIAEVGWAGALLFNERTNRLIDGHLRQEISHDGPVPVLVGSWTEEQERLILATLDPIAALAEAESSALDALLRTVETESEAVKALLERLAAQEGIDLGGEPVADPGAQIDKAAELQEKWQVTLGSLWEIGAHRLICGDCTDGAVVERMMGGEKAGAVVTDPPYGQAYLSNHYGPSRSAPNPMGALEGDKKASPETLDLWLALLDEGSAAYVCSCWEQCETWRSHIAKTLTVKNTIVWHKNNWSAGDLDGAYGFMYELVIFAVSGRHRLNGRRLPDVWEFARCPPALHPTQKPVELFAQCIEKSTRAGDLVADPFLGSGTTAVACQQLGRKCRGVEIEPKYCAVTLERLSQMGLEPRRVE